MKGGPGPPPSDLPIDVFFPYEIMLFSLKSQFNCFFNKTQMISYATAKNACEEVTALYPKTSPWIILFLILLVFPSQSIGCSQKHKLLYKELISFSVLILLRSME